MKHISGAGRKGADCPNQGPMGLQQTVAEHTIEEPV
jgi:hypothetical protein